MKKAFQAIFLITVMVSSFFVTPPTALAQKSLANVVLVSKNALGEPGDAGSGAGIISSDGNFIVFTSEATNLVPDDTNGVGDVFVYDINNETLERVSVDNDGNEIDGDSGYPDISGDGRYVVFYSTADGLVPEDNNGGEDVFLYDRQTGTLELISKGMDGNSSNGNSFGAAISEDARYITFISSADNITADVIPTLQLTLFLYDRQTDTFKVITKNTDGDVGEGSTEIPGISNNGQYVVFRSSASDLVDNDTNGTDDVFVYDITTEEITLVSKNNNGIQANAASYINSVDAVNDSGRVIYSSVATNLVAGDTNGVTDVFVYDINEDTTQLVSLSTEEELGDSDSSSIDISPDGRYASFSSQSTFSSDDNTTGFEDIFIRDLEYGITSKISRLVSTEEEFNDYSEGVSILALGGRYISFGSIATNIAEDTGGFDQVYYAEITDADDVPSEDEDGAPNGGDVNGNGYDDAIEDSIASFLNEVSNYYMSIETSGDCVFYSSVEVQDMASLPSQDTAYDYPAGVTRFNIRCKQVGQTAYISLYFFSDTIEPEDVIVRKYNENTGIYSTIDSATIESVTIGGEAAIKVNYEAEDGGPLDEDGLVNGYISDPVGLGILRSSGGGSGGGSGGTTQSFGFARLATANNPTVMPPAPTCTTTSFTTTMKRGSKFGEVSLLQQTLLGLGFNPGPVDGLFGPKTDLAVKAFQTMKGLVSDGIIGPITRASLATHCLN